MKILTNFIIVIFHVEQNHSKISQIFIFYHENRSIKLEYYTVFLINLIMLFKNGMLIIV